MDTIMNGLTFLYKTCNRKKSLLSASSQDTTLKRCLSIFDLTLMGIGSTLGSGIYILTGDVAKNKTGPAIVLSFFIAGFASVLSGLCYAEFAARIPKAGSAYVYCYVTMGEFCAFVIGWNMLLEYIIGAAVVARGLVDYVDSLTGGWIKNETISITGEIKVPGISSYIDFVSFAIIILFTIFISCGMKNSARLNNFCVSINILTITCVILVGVFYAKGHNWKNFAPYGVPGIIAGASTCFFSFIGFDVIATVSEEARNPAKAIPISMIGTITICFLAYFGVSGVITLMVDYKDLNESAAVAIAFKQVGFKAMAYIIGTGATFGLLGTTLVSLMPVPRMLYSMSQDGLLFEFFSKVNVNTQVPVYSTIISGIFVAFIAAIIDLNELVEMLSIGTLLAYSIVVICVVLLRYEVPDKNCDVNVCTDDKQLVEEESFSRSTNRSKYSTDLGLKKKYISMGVNVTVILLLLELIGISVILSFFVKKITEKNIAVLIVLSILSVALLATTVILSRNKSCENTLSFRVPLVPWIPVLALFFNIYLMSMLSVLTWIRFVVWLAIGLVIYFSYGIRYSKVLLQE
ncbi:cationic amino acid transporter 2 isoform X2 [Hydra vulgaris]|uniref:Cationic amino acid transporter 2 isoform X2 n=1 Tax=Hydra vulgaris TaxID=6087 RepID=A0ABM4C4F8_HYDVU